MRKLLATLALTVLMPLAASAQYIVPEAAEAEQKAMLDRLLSAGPNAESSNLVPMWSTPDGRVLVAVAQSGPPQPPIAPASPQVGTALDWRLIDATTLLDGRVGVRLGENTHLHGGLSLAPLTLAEPALALDCVNSGYLGVIGPDCQAARADLRSGNWYGGNVGASWAGSEFGLELGLALSWLEPALPRNLMPALSSALPAVSAPGTSALPNLVIPAHTLGRFSDSAQFGARGSWFFAPKQSLDLGASIGRIRLSPDPAGSRPLWQQTALSLGLGGSALSTNITGRIYNPLRGSVGADAQRWTGIDLGVTWHTPWQAELSIGAQNLWANPPLTGSEANSQARTPYVQYQQDL
ncbi:hypothetical protein [Tahibacter harae]|uniref:Outer membrane beta-barrel porin/alpha-amylase n=1 Tax=Tahibacter harae TaxID=2963937 RepID=A0ABT1QNF2_9GAMM|nr:hypothetical protein [Tahibacter harae]MCQ4164061.1 hypothetical protein [Tahibacter harae]